MGSSDLIGREHFLGAFFFKRLVEVRDEWFWFDIPRSFGEQIPTPFLISRLPQIAVPIARSHLILRLLNHNILRPLTPPTNSASLK
jgi:hypothetical protein